jgi:hypothetical protein
MDDMEKKLASLITDFQPRAGDTARLHEFAASIPTHTDRSRQILLLAASVVAGAVATVAILQGIGAIGSDPGFGGPAVPIESNDPRFTKCAGDEGPVLAAFHLEHASQFANHFPAAGQAPEMEVQTPAFVVVFDGPYPGPVMPRFSASPPPTPAPGRRDICVWIGDPDDGVQVVYGDVDIRGMIAP